MTEQVKLNRQIYQVEVKEIDGTTEWMCNEHPDTVLEFYKLTQQYEYYACPKCGNYICVD